MSYLLNSQSKMANLNLKSEVLSVLDYFNVKNNSQKEFNECLQYVATHLYVNDIEYTEDEVLSIIKQYFSTLNK